MRSRCLTGGLLVLSALYSYAQKNDHPAPDCRIIGTVIDPEGRPVPNVTVEANSFVSQPVTPDPIESTEPPQTKDKAPQRHGRWLEEDVIWSTEMPEATTNEAGEFEITRLGLMNYELRGENDEYPSAPLTFADGTRAEVTLTREVPVAHVIVRLGLKGGVVRGLFIDKVTGKPVRAMCQVFRFDIGHASGWISTSASESFSYLIPAGTHAALKATAEGYKPACAHVRMGSGEQRVFDLKMEPAVTTTSPTQNATTGCEFLRFETLEPPNP